MSAKSMNGELARQTETVCTGSSGSIVRTIFAIHEELGYAYETMGGREVYSGNMDNNEECVSLLKMLRIVGECVRNINVNMIVILNEIARTK